MHQQICSLIDRNFWLQDGEWEGLELHNYPQTYQIIEAVFVNVAARIEKTWKDIYHATLHEEELFVELCVATIIIEKALKKYHGYTETDVSIILGERLMENLAKYRKLKYNLSLHS